MPSKPPLSWLWKHALRPSTLALLKEAARTPGFSWLDWVHGYVYARWPYLYIGIGTGEHRLAPLFGALLAGADRLGRRSRAGGAAAQGAPAGTASLVTGTMADGYHGKVVPLEAAAQLVTVNEPVRLPGLEKVIPFERARDLVLQNPDHIVALDCPCRVARPDPCLPLDVCLIVGEPFAGFISEHHPERSRPITQAEAVEILRQEDARGHVHHAFFKDAMLGRFYAICNCCPCCCGAMQAQRSGVPMLISSGYVCQVDESLCLGCGECAPACSFEALRLDGYVTAVDEARCMGCGVCAGRCPQEALSLRRAPEKGEPLELFRLMDLCSG